MKTILFIFIFGFFLYQLYSCRNTADVKGNVPNEEAALNMAMPILKQFLEDEYIDYEPYIAKRLDSLTWIVGGTVAEGILGGVPFAKIRKSDGEILEVGQFK